MTSTVQARQLVGMQTFNAVIVVVVIYCVSIAVPALVQHLRVLLEKNVTYSVMVPLLVVVLPLDAQVVRAATLSVLDPILVSPHE